MVTERRTGKSLRGEKTSSVIRNVEPSTHAGQPVQAHLGLVGVDLALGPSGDYETIRYFLQFYADLRPRKVTWYMCDMH